MSKRIRMSIIRKEKKQLKQLEKITSSALCFACGEPHHIEIDCLKEKSDLIVKSKTTENSELVDKNESLESSKLIQNSECIDKSESLEKSKPIEYYEPVLTCEFVNKSEQLDSLQPTEKFQSVVPKMIWQLRKKRRQTKKKWLSPVCFICHEPDHTKKNCPKKESDRSIAPQNQSIVPPNPDSTKEVKRKQPLASKQLNIIADSFPALFAGLKKAQEVQQTFIPFGTEINFKANNSSELDTAAKRRRLMSKLSETKISIFKSDSSASHADLKKGQVSTYSTTSSPTYLYVNSLGTQKSEGNFENIRKNITAESSKAKNVKSVGREESEHVHYVSLKPIKLFTVYDPFEHELKKMSWRQKHPPYGYVFNIDYSVSYDSTGHIIHSTKALLEEVSNCKIQFIPEDGSEKRHFKLTGTRQVIEKVKKLIERSIEKSHAITREKCRDVLVPGPPGRRAIEMWIPGNKAGRITGKNGFVLNHLMEQAGVSMALHPEGIHDETVARTLQIIGSPPMCMQAQRMIISLIQGTKSLCLDNEQEANLNLNVSQINKTVNTQLPLKKGKEQFFSVPANKSSPLKGQSSATSDPWVNQQSQKHSVVTTASGFVHQDDRAFSPQEDDEFYINSDDRDYSRHRNEKSSRHRDDKDSFQRDDRDYRRRDKKDSSRHRHDRDSSRKRVRDSSRKRDDRDSSRKRDDRDSSRKHDRNILQHQDEIDYQQQDDGNSFHQWDNKISSQQQDNSLSFGTQDRSAFSWSDHPTPFGSLDNRTDLAYLDNKVDPRKLDKQAGFRPKVATFVDLSKTTNFEPVVNKADLIGSEQPNRMDYKYPGDTAVSAIIADKFPQSLPQNKTAQLLQYYISLIKEKALSNLQNQTPVTSAEANPISQHVDIQFPHSGLTQLPAVQNNLQPPIGQYQCIAPRQDYQLQTESNQLLQEQNQQTSLLQLQYLMVQQQAMGQIQQSMDVTNLRHT